MTDDDLYQPLSDEEIERLDQFLLDQETETGIFCISQLDGFLTAVVSGPDMIPPSEWLEIVWGEQGAPEWQSEKEYEEIFGLMFQQMNELSSVLMDYPMQFEPLFIAREVDGKTYTIVDEWCLGFLMGVALRYEQWREMPQLDEDVLAPINMFATKPDWEQLDKMNDEEIEFWQAQIPIAVRRIHAYWLDKRREKIADLIEQTDDFSDFDFNVSAAPYIRTTPKVGRNDPCPCGSGKKYKKCCGLH